MAPAALAEPAVAVATIRTLIVVIPTDVPATVLSDRSALHRHFGVTGTPEPRFWTRTRTPWDRRHLVDPRSHRQQSYAAGGPIRLLHLGAQRHAVTLGAGIRHQRWTHVVAGTRFAKPWTDYLRRHHSDPEKYSMGWARIDFAAQPRIQAMNTHNAAYGMEFDPADLEALQAGAHAYATYSAMRSVCGDALLRADGACTEPASDAMSDRIAYLGATHQHIEHLDRNQRLLALAI